MVINMDEPRRIPVFKNGATQDINDVIGWLQLDEDYERKLAGDIEEGIRFYISGTIYLKQNKIRDLYFEPEPCKKLYDPKKPTKAERLAAAKSLEGIWEDMPEGWSEGWNDQ